MYTVGTERARSIGMRPAGTMHAPTRGLALAYLRRIELVFWQGLPTLESRYTVTNLLLAV